jgi:thioredoxin-dependent peroxiredoxin
MKHFQMALLFAAAIPAAGLAQAAPVAAAPVLQVGDMAPDFTLPASTKEGVSSTPLHLKDMRGQTVVLAFFPKVRTGGCTRQMLAYRDAYGTLFNGGKGVALFSISADKPEAQASWAHDSNFVWPFLSDVGGAVGTQYDSWRGNYHNRVVYVIAPDGRISNIMKPFNEIDPKSYSDLKTAIDVARKAKS